MPAGRHDGRKLYLDFDGYFAAVEEQSAPALHGHDVVSLDIPHEPTHVSAVRRKTRFPRGI